MTTTLLFDLDDTLLGNDMETFVPAYFEQLTQSFPPEVNARRLITEIINGTRAVTANRNPSRNLYQVFNDYFFAAMHWQEAEWSAHFDTFYHTRYKHLRELVQPNPHARAIVQWALEAGYEVVIATAPLFPLIAVEERLRWANLDGLPFKHITHLGNSHFAKPLPEYYAEIIAHLGRRPEDVLMVGNDWERDIAPSAALGIASFWIAPAESDLPAVSPARPIGIGDLETFGAWAQTNLATLTAPPPPASAQPALLLGQLAAIAGLMEIATEADWHQRPSPTEWSPTEILCHMRDVDREVNAPRVRAILETHNPFLSAANTDPWAIERNYQAESGAEALQAFLALRQQLCDDLAAQPAEVWQRPARHSLFGPSHLAEIVGWILEHDRLHVQQLKQLHHA